MKCMSSCTYRHVFLNMYDFLYHVEHAHKKLEKKKDQEKVPVLFWTKMNFIE